MTQERILVTGGSGLLGRFVVQALLGQTEVRVFDLKPPVQAEAEFHQGSILDEQAVSRAMQGCSGLIHLAAWDDGAAPDERSYIETNVLGSWTVLEAAERAGIRRVVAASSNAVAGLAPDQPPFSLPIDESHPIRPRGAYQVGKQMLEDMLAAFVRRGVFSAVALRPPLLVRPENAPMIVAELNALGPDAGASGVSVDAPRYGDLPTYRAWISSRDCAAALIAALRADTPGFIACYVAAEDTLGAVDAVTWAEQQAGHAIEVTAPDRFGSMANLSPTDSGLAKRSFGWRPLDRWSDITSLVHKGCWDFQSWN
jgi:UDP-glucose 4-epimerase